MRQKINFYLLLPQKPKYFLTPDIMGQILGAFVAFLLCVSVLQQLHYFIQKAQLSSWTKQYEKTIAELTQYNVRYPQGTPNEQLSAQIKALQTKVTNDQALLIFLTQVTAQTNQVQKKLIVLGNIIIPGVWLTHMHFVIDVPQIFLLEGRADTANNIAYFFQQLKKDPVFADKIFQTFRITNSTKVPGTMDFQMSTQIEKMDAEKKTP